MANKRRNKSTILKFLSNFDYKRAEQERSKKTVARDSKDQCRIVLESVPVRAGIRTQLLLLLLLGFMLVWFVMLFSLFSGKRGSHRSSVVNGMPSSSSSAVLSTPINLRPSSSEFEDRLRGALWGFFAGDALAAPTHWFYGGERQVMQEYGGHPLTDYTKPNQHLAGSILNKSNLNGGGRSGGWGGGLTGKQQPKTIIGDVINHGKQDLWSPSKSIHYHATLQKGENTLEAQIGRVLMKSIVANGGRFNQEHFRNAYIEFMTTPGSHNDTYASTCHRMFFSNLIHRKLPPKDCPDNDNHNVDTIDGLILPTIASLADPTSASACAATTRQSQTLETVSDLWGQVVQASIVQSDDEAFYERLSLFSRSTIRRNPDRNVRDSSTMSACYLSQALPGLIDMTAKYSDSTSTHEGNENKVWTGLLANANVGGENVHRGSALGAVLGARVGASNLPQQMIQGLFSKHELNEEIDSFVAAVMPHLTTETNNQGMK